jgi:hypothetical protein
VNYVLTGQDRRGGDLGRSGTVEATGKHPSSIRWRKVMGAWGHGSFENDSALDWVKKIHSNPVVKPQTKRPTKGALWDT